MSTERTILSPFTKEYRELAAQTGIHNFLRCWFQLNPTPPTKQVKAVILLEICFHNHNEQTLNG